MKKAVNTDYLFHASLSEIGDALRRRVVSSAELTNAYCDRLERLGPTLGALAHATRDLALTQAKAADKELAREMGGGRQRSLLLGVPFGVKDLLATAGIPTEWGSPAHRGQTFQYNATVVDRLEQAGAVLIGKLSMVELAGGGGYRYASASSTGPGRTPWNPAHWAGGSSSGPGAAVAAGLVGFAIGSETWGSIVCPSSFCGVTGLRPTFGRVSRYGAMALSYTMDKLGPMARTAEDCGLLLEVISGPDGRDATVGTNGAFKRGKTKPVRGLRVGIIRPDYADGDPGGRKRQPQTERAFADALGVLKELGVELSDAALPELPTDAAAVTVINVEGSAAFEQMIRDKSRLSLLSDDAQQAGLLAGLVTPGVDYVRSLRIRTVAQTAVARLFENYDALVAPGYLQVAPLVTDNLDEYFVGSDKGLSGLGNLTGIPALCVPMGFGPGGLPLGLQFVGAAFDEQTLLSLGMAFQGTTDWHRRLPPAPFG